ncbi:hypothetical protein [Caulobacter sp.]|uniref:hypothetical protein n=1 Tax=Caulobacter sp. TaxID=78 RepID=UPI003BB07AEB
MTPQQVLNADLSTIGRWLGEGLAWWGRELVELVPAPLRGRSDRGRPLAELLRQTPPSARLLRAGQVSALIDTTSVRPRAVDLLIPNDLILIRDFDAPPLALPDLRRMLALNLDRYTPFTADQVFYDVVFLQAQGAESPRPARLGVMLRAKATALLAEAQALGLVVERLVDRPPSDAAPVLDLLKPIQALQGGDPARRRRAMWWTACGVLAAANLGVAIGRDISETARLRQRVEAQRPTAALAARLQGAVRAERATRTHLLDRRGANDPLALIDTVTRALPSGQWLQRLEWNGRSARLVGFKDPGFDLIEALRGSTRLANPRSLLSDMPTRTPTGKEPFDVMVDARKPS